MASSTYPDRGEPSSPLDGATGRERCATYDPVVDGSYVRRACCDPVDPRRSRDGAGTSVLSPRSTAISSRSMRKLVRRSGAPTRSSTATTRFYTITGAPQIVRRIKSSSETRAPSSACADTSPPTTPKAALVAVLHSAGRSGERIRGEPGDGDRGEDVGPQNGWTSGLGGTVWGEMSYDPELDLLYVGTGNASPFNPIWFRSPIGRRQPVSVSILAIRPNEASCAWHYQTGYPVRSGTIRRRRT